MGRGADRVPRGREPKAKGVADRTTDDSDDPVDRVSPWLGEGGVPDRDRVEAECPGGGSQQPDLPGRRGKPRPARAGRVGGGRTGPSRCEVPPTSDENDRQAHACSEDDDAQGGHAQTFDVRDRSGEDDRGTYCPHEGRGSGVGQEDPGPSVVSMIGLAARAWADHESDDESKESAALEEHQGLVTEQPVHPPDDTTTVG